MAVLEPDDAVLWPQVRALVGWPQPDEDRIAVMGDGWLRTGRRYVEAARYDLGGLGEGWADQAGEAFERLARQHLRTVAVTGSEMIELARRAENFAAEVTGLKQSIVELVAANVGVYRSISTTMPAEAVPDAQRAFVGQMAEEIRSRTADTAARIAAGGGAPLGRAGAPPEGATPAEVKQWWDGLLPQQRDTLRRESPDLIRNLDGIPAAVRDQANRVVLQRELDALLAREAVLLDEAAYKARHEVYDGPASELYQVQNRIADLRAIEEELDPSTGPKVLLLGLDTADDGRAIIALGDPDTATNVATLVPGAETTIGFVPGELSRARNLWTEAQLANDASTATSTSVISWIGYDTPDSWMLAADESYATAAKGNLDRFQDGLRVTHQGEHPSLNTVVGHSYGTTVIGHAARDESLAVDKVVLVSSPGTGSDHVTDLRLDNVPAAEMGQRVFATTPANDPIRLSNIRLDMAADTPGAQPYLTDDLIHNLDPTDPEFGARVFEPDVVWSSVTEIHYAPLHHGNKALDEMGEIIAGNR